MISTQLARSAALALIAAGLAGLPDRGEAASDCGASYTVRSGDTLAAIAERCATSVEALTQANPLVTDPARISIGWKLTIPGARASLGPESEVRPPMRNEAAEAAVTAGSYEVRPGDSFASIATSLRVPMRALMGANKGVDPFALKPGQVLKVPAGDAFSEPKSEAGQADAIKGADAAKDSASRQPARTDESAEARAGDTEAARPAPSGALERLTLEGRVERGTECPVLQTSEGETYSLVSSQYGFAPGDYVEIEGERVEMSFCSEGVMTVRVTSMTTLRAPQGG